MKAIQIQEQGSLDHIKVVDLPKPDPEPGKVQVRMKFSGINPVDGDVLMGFVPFAKQPPIILGTEGAGMVEEGDENFPKGQQVMVYGGMMGVVQDGVWQEYINVDPSCLVAVPPGLTLMEASCISMVYLTAKAALEMGNFKQGMSVLVTTMGGGVGNAAYQLAVMRGASKVIGTVGTDSKYTQAVRFVDGLFRRPIVWSSLLGRNITTDRVAQTREETKSYIINLGSEDVAARVMEITEGKGVDFIIDTLGGDYLPKFIDITAPGGTIMSVGYKAGLESTINIMPMLAKQLRFLGTNVFNLSPDQTTDLRSQVFSLIRDHNLRPTISEKFPVEQAADALRYLMNERPFGKVILQF